MTYSFSLKAANSQAMREQVAATMEKLVAEQPCHTLDAAKVVASANSLLGMIPAREGHVVAGAINGYVSGTFDGKGALVDLGTVSMSMSFGLVPDMKVG